MKKIIIAVVAVVLLAGGITGGYFYAKSKKEAEKEEVKKEKEKVWNPYSEHEKHHKSLNEFLISAVNGTYVIKMNVTLDLKDEDAVHKFDGLEAAPTEEAAEGGHGGGTEEVHITPMQTFISSKIGTYMLNTDEATLHDKAKLEEEMKSYLNKELKLDKDFIKHVYIENFIIQ